MEERFNIGDRVIAIVDSPADNASIHAGDAGTVCSTPEYDGWIGVFWDNPVDGGHDCEGNCEFGYGWRVPAGAFNFEPEDDKPPFLFDDEEFRNLFN